MKRWKNFLAFLLTAVMLLALPGIAWAADEVASGECGDALTWTLDSDGMLTVSGIGDMPNFGVSVEPVSSYVSTPWYENREEIKTVEIQNAVTSIGRYAFSRCNGLMSVSIPDSVTRIGYEAFSDCSGLKDVYYGGTKAQWNQLIIENDEEGNIANAPLLDATIHCTDGNINPKEETGNKCGDNLFWTLEDGVLTISGTGAMYEYYGGGSSDWDNNRKEIKTVEIQDGVTSISHFAFELCDSLTNVSIPDSVTFIGAQAFMDCSSLTNVTIPESVTDIGGHVFNSCSSLTSVIIPEGITRIRAGTFMDCDSLTSFTIPESVTSIDVWAFLGCSNLENITIPKNVTSIASAAFSGCSTLTSITIPGNVTEIGSYPDDNFNSNPFAYCDNLRTVIVDADNTAYTAQENVLYNKDMSILVSYPAGKSGPYSIPDSVTSIEFMTFAGCSGLTSITIPESVARIEEGAFWDCSSLTDVYYSGTKTQWEQIDIVRSDEYEWDGDSNAPLRNATIHYQDEEEPATPTPLEPGVKYVPYSWKPEESSGTYSVSAGTLPNGLSVDPQTGEISGIPMVSGSWSFTISNQETETPYTLTIADNSNDAVDDSNDSKYEIVVPVGTETSPNQFILYEYTDRTMKIDGPYDEFMELYIDGQKLTRGVDYEAREGSTVITIYAQTFKKFGEGTHTLSAEYREGGDPNGKLKTVSQNYTVSITQPSTPTRPSGSSSGSSSNKKPSSSSGKPASTTPTTPTTPVTPAPAPVQTPAGMAFGDVNMSDWFYEDVKWAYDGEIMTGVTATSFAPAQSISQATIVTVLARLGNIDLTRYETAADSSIASGKWYTAAAIWAKQSGILPDYSTFTGEEIISRDQMAIMLVKYLRSMGRDTNPPAQAAAFEDAALMSQDGNNAFQVLYRYNIFRGVGGGRMDPSGSTTRAQFAALVHRLSDTAAN